MPSVLLSACGSIGTDSGAGEYCNGADESAVMGAILTLLQDYLQVSGLRAPIRPIKLPSAMAATYANRQRVNLLFTMRSYSAPAKQGIEICFFPASEKSRRAAQLLLEHLAPVAPDAKRVILLPSPQLPEFRMARCPAVQLRLGCRADQEDAQWMLQRTGVIAHALAGAITEWFGIPCKSPFSEFQSRVRAPGGALALRSGPRGNAEILRPLVNGTRLTLLHREGDWQYVEVDGKCGYVQRRFLRREIVREVKAANKS